MTRTSTILLLAIALLAPALSAKEELVTLPPRDSVQLTIYNSEDLTLVREKRTLSFKQGDNRLQFSWSNTLIDPTSVEFRPVEDKDGNLEVSETSYPPESHEMLIWTISCKKEGAYKAEISYFTSGISWSAEYHGIVSDDEAAMDLTGFVTVHNHSGEDYEGASVRLVVGVIHMVERVIDLAQPGHRPKDAPAEDPGLDSQDLRNLAEGLEADSAENGMSRPKEIDKSGLSEYYIYTVEGTETVPNNWSKRLRSFTIAGIPMKTVYHFEPQKFGPLFTKVLEFKNDEEHKLGKEPLPDGVIRLYRSSKDGALSWMGALASKYIAKNDEVKINVGPDPEVTMKEKRKSYRKSDLTFERNGNTRWIAGWTDIEEFEIEIKNFRGRAVEIEIHRSAYGDFDFASNDTFTAEDFQTRKFTFSLAAGNTKKLAFTVTTRQGSNAKK
ncbi:MAG: DUF4139 domain-containing protein [Planctomycetes bacterium]|nr:DUF4139 domain-containing protein [Planctomycetota bacterium]